MNKKVKNYFIKQSVSIYKNTVFIDGIPDFFAEEKEEAFDFFKQIYKHYEVNYSKYFKMDRLSKLGFLTAHILLKNKGIEHCLPQDTAIVLINSAASLDTDRNFQNSMKEIASPAVFVYTLPNIVIGEICIKYNIKGETAFFVQEKLDTDFLIDYINVTFATTNTKQCLVGWVDVDNDHYKSQMLWITTEKTSQILNKLNFNKILN